MLLFQRSPQSVLQRQPLRQLGTQVQAMMQVLLTGRLRLAQRRLRVLQQRLCVGSVGAAAGQAGLHRHRQRPAVDLERGIEQVDRVIAQEAQRFLLRARVPQDHGEISGTEIGELLRAVDGLLQPVRDLLEQEIADVPSLGVVDHAQVFDVEHGDGGWPGVLFEPREVAGQALAEQVVLREAGQAIVVRQEFHRALFRKVLQREREVGGHFVENAQLPVAHRAGLAGREHEHAHGGPIHGQR